MHARIRSAALLGGVAVLSWVAPVGAQHEGHTGHGADTPGHAMWATDLGAGWRLVGMGQAYPIVTIGAPRREKSPFRETGWYLTQPVVMADLMGPGGRVVLRTTLNFEGVTQPGGELTLGGWGEGFIDKRHPHTLLHEFMLSVSFEDVAGGSASVSAGRGFAPYGTDDPMSRPGLKYPTNHHLSQILERWTLNGVYLRGGWGLELGVFGGAEPDGPYDFGGLDTFGDSWSARLSHRWGGGVGPFASWEASVSFASVAEQHHGGRERTALLNVALRHAEALESEGARYFLLEYSRSDPEHGTGYHSALGEVGLEFGGHQPYVRIESATRPEYGREGVAGADEFFRYHHGASAIGATRWLIGSAGYAYRLTGFPVSVRPFLDAQVHRIAGERGGIDPRDLFGGRTFWSLSVGARLFFGGDPMRMGAYGVLDPMQVMERTATH